MAYVTIESASGTIDNQTAFVINIGEAQFYYIPGLGENKFLAKDDTDNYKAVDREQLRSLRFNLNFDREDVATNIAGVDPEPFMEQLGKDSQQAIKDISDQMYPNLQRDADANTDANNDASTIENPVQTLTFKLNHGKLVEDSRTPGMKVSVSFQNGEYAGIMGGGRGSEKEKLTSLQKALREALNHKHDKQRQAQYEHILQAITNRLDLLHPQEKKQHQKPLETKSKQQHSHRNAPKQP